MKYPIKRKYKILCALTFVVIAAALYIWYFTLVPDRMGWVDTLDIDFVALRRPVQSDYSDIMTYEKDGVIEFFSPKKLEDSRQGRLRLIGTNRSDVTYQAIYADKKDEKPIVLIESNSVHLSRLTDSGYVYMAVFDFQRPKAEIKELGSDIYCKVFFIRMFSPIHETNEMVIPYNHIVTCFCQEDTLAIHKLY
ncbi:MULTISPECIES: hypothetical protein [Bacteroidales]|uniref:Uncharacterized protein n=1 Tax=Tannerella forsythia TaxID=28112 RepID=A0A3P1XE17_TANFO|nr:MULTISPECIES: hypothetical protein [Bacteroidales]RRD56691.1 hypothetical protein EII40_13580 [Tannerella forsythia]